MRVAGDGTQSAAYTWNNFGSLYQDTRRYAESEQAYLRSIAAWQKCCPGNPGAARVENNLGSLYLQLGQVSRARKLLERSYADHARILGPNDPETARVLHNLAAVLVASGRAPVAEPLYRRALEAREASLGPNHPDVAATLAALAVVYAQTSRETEARQALEQADRICSSAFCGAPERADIWTNLGSLFALEGHTAEAEPLLLRALRQLERILPPYHPRLTPVLLNCAATLRALHRRGEAKAFERKAREIQAKHSALNPFAGVIDASNLR